MTTNTTEMPPELQKAIDVYHQARIDEEAEALIELLTEIEAKIFRLADQGVDIVKVVSKARTGRRVHPSRLPK